MEELLSVDEFAERIKAKYPAYAQMDNLTLVQKIIAKYPEYKNQVDLSTGDSSVVIDEKVDTEISIEDIQNNVLIVDNTIVDGKPFADLNFEEQSNYINQAGNYAEDEKGTLLFLPKNRQEVDMTWDLPKDKSGRRYFPDQLTGGLFDEISEEEISTETIPPAPQRQGTRPNVDDQDNVVSESTHLMKAEQLEDGNWVAFPSLFQNPNGEWVDMSGEKNWEPIYQEALKRGEVIEFGKNKEAAIAYGEGSWKEKDTSPFPDLSLENLSTRGNRNENVEILSDYTIAKKPYSTVHVNGKRVLPANINKDAPNIAITIADETLNLLNINKQDYVNWERETLRGESERFKKTQGILRSDEGEKLAIEKRNAEKLSAYMITLSNGIEEDLKIINAKLTFISDPIERARLEDEREVLRQDWNNNLIGRWKLVQTNEYLKNQKESETAKNINIFNEGQEGGLSYGLTETKNFFKSFWNAFPQFFIGTASAAFGLPDQATLLGGYDKKGILAATQESLEKLTKNLQFDIPQRPLAVDGKKVYSVVNGENHPFIVTAEGQILDEITHVNMQGILTDQQYESILKNSKGEKTETFYSLGSGASGMVSTIANLFALIKSGKWFTKGINKAIAKTGSKAVAPAGVGMGVSSYASTVIGEVEDIRATLVRNGISEKDAMKYAIAAGNSRATLDGIFSGLAGGNLKLLDSYKNIAKTIVDIAKKPSTWAKKGVFQQKVKEFAKENFKEVFVEELPVLYSGTAINSMVNSILEKEVLDAKVGNAEFYETIILTLGATSTLGVGRLRGGNSRSAMLDIAASTPDLKKNIDKLVQDGMITKEEGRSAYDEIYGMQIANNISEGAITLPHNKIEYSNLAEQRKTLVEQAKNLDGPGKERVQKKIEALDAQLEALIVKDEGEIKTELEKEKEKSPTLVTTKEARASLEQENEIKTRSGKGVIIRLTDEAIETRRQELNKEKQDAIQKPSTEKVDVSKPTKDSRKVGKGDTTGDITTEGKKKDQVTPKKTAQEEVVQEEDTKPLFTPQQLNKKSKTQILEEAKNRGYKNVNAKQTKAEMINAFDKENKLRKKQDAAQQKEQNKKRKQADSVVSKIKRLIQKGNAPAEVIDAAKEFVKLKTNMVKDYDSFITKANSIVKGLISTKIAKKGKIKVTEALDIKSVDEYTKKEKEIQDKQQKKADEKAFTDLTGLDPKDITLDELRRILYHSETDNLSPEKKATLRETKKGVIAQGLKNAFNKYAAVVDSIVNKGVDPFTGEKIKLSETDKKLVRRFLKIDIGSLPALEAAKALDAMVNFATNQSVGGMKAVVNFSEGRQNAKDNEGKLKAKPLKFLLDRINPLAKIGIMSDKFFANQWNKWISSIPLTIENMFKSQRVALFFEKISGFTDIRNGAAKAEKIAQEIAEAYYDKFINPGNLIKSTFRGNTKTMPNGKRFNDVENDIERGLFAFMRRTVDGTEVEQEKEFKRRKGLIKLSIKELRNSSVVTDNKKADVYQKVFDKLLKNSNNINDVESNTDNINIKAVDWMTKEWTQARPELEDVSLSIYNRTLGKDLNYTPDSFTRLDDVESEPDLDDPLFQPDMNESVYDKETGVLKPKRPSPILPMDKKGTPNRYVNLGFDSNNVNNLRSAYTDINTAPGIQTLKGFMSSPSFEKIIPNAQDRALLKERFKTYVKKKRGLQKGQEKWVKNLNKVAGVGISRVLGGPSQFVKQLVPIINTAANLIGNPKALYDGINLITTNTDAIKWLNKSGVEIANRGVQAITNLEGTDSRLDTDAEGPMGKFGDVINNAQKSWLQGFLINPDRFAARASFMAYYLDNLNKQGIDSNTIDWKTHKPNQDALNYATQQTARQQNTSDVDLQGELFSGKDPITQVTRKILFPFANFLLNQKTRMYTDLGSVFSKSNTWQDKVQSGKSLTGLVAETAVFNALGLFVTQSLAAIAKGIRGTDEDEETLEKQFGSRYKGRKGQVMADIVSPIPLFNPEVAEGVNALIKTFASEDPFQFFVNKPETLMDRLGVLGIPFEKAQNIYKMVMLGTTGKYTDRYGREITIDPQYKEDILAQAPIYTMYLLGFLPLEAGSIMDYNMRAYKKTREKEKGKVVPLKKEKEKSSKKRSVPISPFKRRRKKTGPSSPF